ncbi:EthD domain-containing protein [Bosea sp. (in: a-proteobacteria)]|uniref:EthD domain-containing protein n=1 Tax=Bosea sp. (in: a-proteobacteria) TaxID=1871050 RepID=UPI00260F5F91|nr:EthD domain-containing protein [Bosea sp. (in: a-proteobacteria)]MCO5091263.1 EthD family reductase [Bosea sp. (in: a-proteobacteria)]
MLKRMTLLARRSDLTFDAFSSHWLGTHGEIVTRMPMVHGYVQNPIGRRLLEKLNPQDPFSFDGIVELWFADAQAQKTAFASAAAKELPVDELNFIRGITIFPVEESRQDAGGYPLKVMVAARFGGGDAEAHITALTRMFASLPGVRVAAVNRLGEVGWRDHLWHEPEPPQLLIELACENTVTLDRLADQAALSALHASLTASGGALECYRVDPRTII